MFKVWCGVAVLVSALHAQPVELGLRLIDPHLYRERELVRVELTGTGWGTRSEWQFHGFVVDPARECGTQEKPCFPPVMGLSPGEIGISDPSARRIVAVNHYVPRLTPGRYKVRMLARRMVYETSAQGTTGRYAEPAEYRTSDAVEFEVVSSDANWVRATIAACQDALRGSQPRTPEENQTWIAAAQQLAWLDTAASREAALAVLPKQESLILVGLGQTRAPAELCDRMQARVALPDQSVSTRYVYAMTEVCAKAHLPPAPVPAGGSRPVELRAVIRTAPPPATAARPDPQVSAWLEKRREYTEGLWDRASAALAESLPAKQAEPRWSAFATLLQRVEQVRVNRPPRSDPQWVPALTAEFVRTYPAVEVARQRYLLDMFTSTIRSPEVAPLLESVLDSWKPGDYYEAAQSAIRGLNAIDPARAQARLRAELTRPQTWLGREELAMLPASAVPPMDDALLAALAAAQRPGGWNPQLRMAALARYGTRRALPKVRAIYESQEEGCQPELLAYFVRFDPAYADRVFHSHPWDMHAPPSPCTVQIFMRTAPLAMSPELEKYMAAYLMHSDVYVKTTAARMLGRCGSPAALPALWDALRYFREWWKGKSAELAQNGEGIHFEVELRNAIARGRGWVALPSDLRLIQATCSSDWCRSETRSDLIEWEGPPRITLSPSRSGTGSRVAQYGDLAGLEDVEGKLAQFPRGTRFTFDGTGREADELRRFAAAHGLLVTAR